MADFDEDLFEDIDFDDDALALIDAQTSRIVIPAPIAPVKVAPAPPRNPAPPRVAQAKSALSRPAPAAAASPAKRQRIASGWVSAGPQRGASDDDDDLPDIVIREDGSYAAAPAEPAAKPVPRPVRPTVVARNASTTSRAPSAAPAPATRAATPSRSAAAGPALPAQPTPAPVISAEPPPVHIQPPPIAQPPPPQNAPAAAPVRRLGMRPQRNFQSGRQGAQSRSTLSVVEAAIAAANLTTSTQTQAPPPAPSQRAPVGRTRSQVIEAAILASQASQPRTPPEYPHQENLGALQQQLAELKRQNEAIFAQLKSAQDIQFAKEGEVSLLRRGIDKTAQEHASALASLREAKEAAEAAQVQARRELTDEMERLRTQYQFKQQELETSNRRGLGTARKARVGAMPPPTPVPLPSQMRNWASGPGPQEGTITSSQARHLRTPTRPRVGLHNRDSPRRRKDANTLPGPSNAPKALNGALPGFQNSFASPSHGSSRRGKRTITRAPPGLDTPTPARSRRGGSGEPPSPPSSPTYGDDIRTAAVFPLMDDQKMSSPGLDMDMDAIGDQELMAPPPLAQLPDQPGLVEEVSVDPIVWRDELQRIVLSHFAVGSDTLAMQVIMTAKFSDEVDISVRTRYNSACATVLRQMGIETSWTTVIAAIPEAFVEIMHVLTTVDELSPLTALVDLLGKLCFSIRDFPTALLSSKGMDCQVPDGSPIPESLGFALVKIVNKHIRVQPEAGAKTCQSQRLLSEAVLTLMESLLCNVSDDVANRLYPVVDKLDCFYHLVTANQPTWLISRTARLVSFISTRENLARLLMSPPPPLKEGEAPKTTSLPLLDALLHRLVERKRDAEEALSRDMREAICIFVATVSTAYPEAHRTMLSSKFLIPAIVNCLYYNCNPLFNEDPALVNSPQLASKVLRATSHTLFLLYHLVLGRPTLPSDEKDDLPDESHYLYESVHLAPDFRLFQSTRHFFMVALSLVAHSDPPAFLPSHDRKECIFLKELADELLNLIEDHDDVDNAADVVRGWRPFQEESDPVDEILHDEEEMAQEAQRHQYLDESREY